MEHSETIRAEPAVVVVADDRPLVVRGIVAVLSRSMPESRFVEAGSLAQLREALAGLEKPASLAVMRLNLGDHAGITTVRTVRELIGSTPLLVTSSRATESLALAALRAGANGFVAEHTAPRTLGPAATTVMEGGRYTPFGRTSRPAPGESQDDTEHVDPAMEGPQRDEEAVFHLIRTMPRRRAEILALLVQGCTNSEICRRLSISPNTVKSHVAMIFNSVGIHSRVELAALLRDHRELLVDVPPRQTFRSL